MVRDIMQKNEKVNPNNDLLKKMKALIPNAFGKDGSVDADAIRYWAEHAVGDKHLVVEERETFNFLGKDYARLLYALDTETVIIPDEENNKKKENKNSENLYLSGDNLEVLKHLRRSYEGQVKCIYIDPPYNTGSDDFIYNDNFNYTEEELVNRLGIDPEQAIRIMKMTGHHNSRKQGSRSHAAWLTFMYPRLKLARDLLKNDGVIFISIDDNEQANLKILCDEIFGEENFCGQLIIQTATDNNPRQICTEHEYMMCFAKDLVKNWMLKSEAAKKIKEQYERIKERETDLEKIQEKLRKWIKENKSDLGLKSVAHYNNVDENGVYSSSTNSSNPHPGGYMFDIPHPVTGRNCPRPANGWRWPETTFWNYANAGQVEWGDDHKTQPHIKQRIETATDALRSIIYEDNRASTKMVADLFDGKKVFDNPKPLNVITRIMNFSTEKNDIIMDFFSGSGTTAHSILQLNALGNDGRKYIAIQLPEPLDAVAKPNETTKNAIKLLESLGKPRTLDQIGMERIRRAAAKIKSEHPDAKCDFGFKHYTIEKPKEKTLDALEKFVPNPHFGADNILKAFGAKTVLATWMVDDGHSFNASVETIDLGGYTAYKVKDYLYLIDKDIDTKHMKTLFKKYDEDKKFKPKHIVVFGYSFGVTALETLKGNIKGIEGIDINLEIRY